MRDTCRKWYCIGVVISNLNSNFIQRKQIIGGGAYNSGAFTNIIINEQEKCNISRTYV